MWLKSMQFIVASIAKKYWQKIMKIGEILKQMYFRKKPNTNCGFCLIQISILCTPISELSYFIYIYIYCMYKYYFCEIMRPPEFRGPGSGEPPEP